MSENKSFLGRQPLFLQLFIVVGLFLFCTSLFTAVAMILVKPLYGITGADVLIAKAGESPEALKGNLNEINAIKFLQLMISIGMFIVPALIFGALRNFSTDYLKLRTRVKPVLLLLSIIILIAALPLVNFLYELNQQIKLPASMKDVEDVMQKAEELGAKVTELFLFMPTFSDFLFTFLVVGIVPAVGEELLFRGVLQQLFRDSTKNIHVAIWVSAFLFSAFHNQFYGFIPRMALGALFGYVFYWSGSLWAPIAGHLVNNGMQVVLAYLFQQKVISYDINAETATPIYVTLISVVILVGLVYYFNKNRVPEPVVIEEQPVTNNPEDPRTWQ